MNSTKINKINLLFTAFLTIGLTACATISPGLQSGELPPVGTFVAENGITFNVQPLNLSNLPSSLVYPESYASGHIAQNGLKNSRINDLISSPTANDYRLAEGDILSITLIGYPEITPPNNSAINASNPYAAGYPVDQQGYVQFPLVGRVKASGSNVSQFTNSLRMQLQRYLNYPDPQVKVVSYRGNKFFIDGEVRQPGEFNIADTPVSLYSAISMAGGTTPEGDSNSVVLNRNGIQYHIGLKDLQDMGVSPSQIYLKNGDSLHINSRDRSKVFVLGEFGEIRPLEIPEHGLSLAHVIGQSRGLNPTTANAAKIYIVRDRGYTSYTDIYYINLQTVTNLALANRFNMQPNDIVYVDPTGLTRWSRFINSILPSTSAVRQLSSL